jgi:Pyruvate/2-oxoacid:ferredoxin oxidoreductase delta subunit
MSSNNEGWDDEAAAIRKPEKWRCHNCEKEFFGPQVRIIVWTDNEGRMIGYPYCLDCLVSLKPEGCPLVAYHDPRQYEYLCFNCPIPELICDLRGKTASVVKKE